MTQRLTGNAVGIMARAAALRRARKWTADDLGEAMTAAGVPWQRSVIANIESGRRGTLSIDEWLTLASVLGVAPLDLLCPDDGSDFRVNPTARPMSTDRAREWIVTGRAHRRTGTAVARGGMSGAKVVESLADRITALEQRIDEREV